MWQARLVLVEIWGLVCVSEAVQGLRIVYLTADDERWVAAVEEDPSDRTIEDYRTLQSRLRLTKAGIIDAAKVTRSALQNAASIAALFLTTEAVIADKPEEKAAPAMPGGGMEDF
ncbi:MAG TPA: hypothetical protein VIX41_00730 [Acidimicrobiales bacterium]